METAIYDLGFRSFSVRALRFRAQGLGFPVWPIVDRFGV